MSLVAPASVHAQANPWLAPPRPSYDSQFDAHENAQGRNSQARRFQGYRAWQQPDTPAQRYQPERRSAPDRPSPARQQNWGRAIQIDRDRRSLLPQRDHEDVPPQRNHGSSRMSAAPTYRSPAPSYRRLGRFVPSYATGQFDLPPSASPQASYGNYPPPGYDPTVRLDSLRPQSRNGLSARPQWPAQQAYRDPGRSFGQADYGTPPWAVNPGWNTASPGFAGPTTFGNPFGSPYGGLAAPYGFPSTLGIPPGIPIGGFW